MPNLITKYDQDKNTANSNFMHEELNKMLQEDLAVRRETEKPQGEFHDEMRRALALRTLKNNRPRP